MTKQGYTKREVLIAMLEESVIADNPNYKEYCEHEIELLDKKRENKTLSKTQVRNEVLKAEILDLMVEGTTYTCTQIVKMLNEDDVQSTQKGTALLKSLMDEGKVIQIKDKKSTLYKRV